jgi:hypothetical protein
MIKSNNMKKIVIISGIFFIILNTVALFIFSNYQVFNNILVSFSILSTFIFLYLSSSKKNVDAYRISLSFIYSFLGFVKIVISFLSKSDFKDNYSIIWILGIIFIEIILLFAIEYMNKHAKT